MERLHVGRDGRTGRRHALLLVLAGACLAPSAAPARAEPAPSATPVRAEPAPEACPVTPSEAVANVPPASVPEAAPPPDQILVCVQRLPITGAVFSHWADVARRSEGASPSDRAGTAVKVVEKHPATVQEVAKEVLGFLISSDWVLGEADALHIHLSARTVRRRFERIRAQQFPKPGEFGRFLTDSGQTAEDLLLRVRLNLLSMRIQEHVMAGHHRARAQQQALRRFVQGFGRRWRARTYCTPQYAVVDCGHVVAPPL
jgi:hypothetical protein